MALKFMLTFIVLFVVFFLFGLERHLEKDYKRRDIFAKTAIINFYAAVISLIFWILS